jgi:hypothetical protein
MTETTPTPPGVEAVADHVRWVLDSGNFDEETQGIAFNTFVRSLYPGSPHPVVKSSTDLCDTETAVAAALYELYRAARRRHEEKGYRWPKERS